MARALLVLLVAVGSVRAERLTLPQAVREALARSAELKARALDLDRAGADVISAKQHPGSPRCSPG